MATSGFKVCGICEMRQKTNEATVWCPECEDPLCADCKENHSISKATRGHTTVPIDAYQRLPPFILDAKMFCEEHDEKFHHYCMTHQHPLCKTCIVSSHAACKDLKIIEDVIGNCKTSYAMESVEKDLKEILCNIQHLKQDRASNLSAIKEQRSTIITMVSDLRDRINQHLDRIEKAFLAELSSMADENQKRITDLQDSLTTKESRIEQLQSSIRGMKEHASDFQTFIGMKKMEKRIHEEKNYIRSIFENASLNQIELSCSFDNLLENLTSRTRKFGTLSVKETPSQANLDIESTKQAQIKSPADNQDNKPQLQLDHQMNIPTYKNKEITCCCTLKTGIHVLAYQCGLAIYRSDLSFMHVIPIEGYYPTDITQTNAPDIIAVATGHSKIILVINILEQAILKTIRIQEFLWGITFRDGCLMYCAYDIGIKKINMSQSFPSSKCIYQMNFKLPSLVKAIGDKICITDESNKVVKLLGPNMKELYHSNNQDNLTKPAEITADELGYIYIANYESPSNIVVFSPNGHLCHSFELTELKSVCGLSYDCTTKRLVVATIGRKVSFYKIRH